MRRKIEEEEQEATSTPIAGQEHHLINTITSDVNTIAGARRPGFETYPDNAKQPEILGTLPYFVFTSPIPYKHITENI